MKQLIVAETRSVAEEISRVISDDKFKNKQSYLENKTHIITWCIDHLNENVMPENDDSRSVDTLPFIPKTLREQLGVIKALFMRHDVKEIVNACDAGREGEFILGLIYHYLKPEKSYKRLWICSYEDSVIKEGMAKINMIANKMVMKAID